MVLRENTIRIATPFINSRKYDDKIERFKFTEAHAYLFFTNSVHALII